MIYDLFTVWLFFFFCVCHFLRQFDLIWVRFGFSSVFFFFSFCLTFSFTFGVCGHSLNSIACNRCGNILFIFRRVVGTCIEKRAYVGRIFVGLLKLSCGIFQCIWFVQATEFVRQYLHLNMNATQLSVYYFAVANFLLFFFFLCIIQSKEKTEQNWDSLLNAMDWVYGRYFQLEKTNCITHTHKLWHFEWNISVFRLNNKFNSMNAVNSGENKHRNYFGNVNITFVWLCSELAKASKLNEFPDS